jgi:hypothetical protein
LVEENPVSLWQISDPKRLVPLGSCALAMVGRAYFDGNQTEWGG